MPSAGRRPVRPKRSEVVGAALLFLFLVVLVVVLVVGSLPR